MESKIMLEHDHDHNHNIIIPPAAESCIIMQRYSTSEINDDHIILDMPRRDEVLSSTCFPETTTTKIRSSVQSDGGILREEGAPWDQITAGLQKVSNNKDSGRQLWTIYEVEQNLKKVHEDYTLQLQDDPMYTWRSTLAHLRHDLLLLENQLPFIVLQEIFAISGVDRERYKLTKLILNFFNPVLYRPKSVLDVCKKHMDISNCHHLLHLFMSSFQTRKTDEVQQPENITSNDTGCDQEMLENNCLPEVINPNYTPFTPPRRPPLRGLFTRRDHISYDPCHKNAEYMHRRDLSWPDNFPEVIPTETSCVPDKFSEVNPNDTSCLPDNFPEVIRNDTSCVPDNVKEVIPNDTGRHQKISFMSCCCFLTSYLPEVILKSCTTTPGPEQDMSIHCVTELRAAGVEFEKRDHHNLLDIEFKGGKLHIPTLFIDDNTVPALLNFVAYEQRHHSIKPYFTSYLMFLDYLVNSSKDVEYLHYKGIMNHGLGSDEEVATLLNKLCKEVVRDLCDDNYLSPVFADVNRYFSKRLNRWRAAWKHEYFKTPWAFSSFLAAIFLILLTVMQTYFAWYAYFYPPSK